MRSPRWQREGSPHSLQLEPTQSNEDPVQPKIHKHFKKEREKKGGWKEEEARERSTTGKKSFGYLSQKTE